MRTQYLTPKSAPLPPKQAAYFHTRKSHQTSNLCASIYTSDPNITLKTKQKMAYYKQNLKTSQAHLQHSTGMEAVCRERTFPLGCGMCTRNTSRTLVFFLPISVSPFRSSISELRSFKIPAQSILGRKIDKFYLLTDIQWSSTTQLNLAGKNYHYLKSGQKRKMHGVPHWLSWLSV